MEDGCNSGSDVINQFTRLDALGNPVELECYEFAGIRELPDGITGELDGYPDLNDNVRKCPNFANWGCFSGNFTEVEGSQYKTSINKGCSMFDLTLDLIFDLPGLVAQYLTGCLMFDLPGLVAARASSRFSWLRRWRLSCCHRAGEATWCAM